MGNAERQAHDAGHPPRDLTEREMRVLEFERSWWRHAGAKEQAIRDEFGISAARYYQILGGVIDLPAALVHDPMLVKRLLRLRDARMARRAARTDIRSGM